MCGHSFLQCLIPWGCCSEYRQLPSCVPCWRFAFTDSCLIRECFCGPGACAPRPYDAQGRATPSKAWLASCDTSTQASVERYTSTTTRDRPVSPPGDASRFLAYNKLSLPLVSGERMSSNNTTYNCYGLPIDIKYNIYGTRSF